VTAAARDPNRRLNLAPYLRALAAALRRVPPEERAREGPHAQFGEDRILERIFGNQDHGYCVEVGAYDGLTGSATFLFERKGWQCLLVEPVPELADQIRRNRRCLVANCAASAEEGEAVFYVADRVQQMSTLELTSAQEEWIVSLGGAPRAIKIPTRTLDSLLDEAGFARVDFITIDVEGHEMDVLRGFTLELHRPRVVILEENVVTSNSDIERHMAEHRYLNFKRTGVNDWYAHESDAELVRPDAVRQFQLEKSVRRSVDRVKERIAGRMPASVKRRLAR
jgi:FkbM family methyltransferase